MDETQFYDPPAFDPGLLDYDTGSFMELPDPNSIWFTPMSFMEAMYGVDSGEYQTLCKMCPSLNEPQLINKDAWQSTGPYTVFPKPSYECYNPGLSWCDQMRYYLLSVFLQQELGFQPNYQSSCFG